MILNHNMRALNAQRNTKINSGKASKSMEKLSSGLRINRAGDDAAGLAISEKMRGQIRGLNQASRNSQDGISLIQTAEGALNETHSILQRMRELAVQASNDTNVSADRENIQAEIDQLVAEIDRIASQTEFNTKKLLFVPDTVIIQVGANEGQTIEVTLEPLDSLSLSLDKIDTTSSNGAQAAITSIDQAMTLVSTQRSDLGAIQNRLEHSINNLGTTSENLTASESRIRDVDMAKEMTEYSKDNILQQAAQAMLAQANQEPQNVLSLLR